jgi:predicted O-methyltransferase YrrM
MLRTIELPDFHHTPTAGSTAARLLEEADRRIDQFIARRNAAGWVGFVPSDFVMVDACLEWIAGSRAASGAMFCEWGSGFGVVTMLAALRDFNACGIEVDAELVDEARRLADDFGIAAEFAHGSMIPDGQHRLLKHLDDSFSHVETDSPSGYDELGLGPDDFDLIFTFPWPGEEQFAERLFDRCAADGALLLSYHGINDLRLQRRVRR